MAAFQGRWFSDPLEIYPDCNNDSNSINDMIKGDQNEADWIQ